MIPLFLFLTIGSEFSVEVPEGWAENDGWAQQVPYAQFEKDQRKLSVERYRRDDPLQLKPADLIAALNEGDPPKKTRRQVGKKTYAVYEVEKRARPVAIPDADEDAEALGPGEPGIRSRIERCRGRGVYQLAEAYASARLDKDRLELFRAMHLGSKPQRDAVTVCLGTGALGAMREGAPFDFVPPDDAQVARLEKLEREAAGPPIEIQAVSIVEARDRFYVLRYTAPTDSYRPGLPIFDRFLSSFKAN